MTISYPEKEQESQLRALWKTAFGDTDNFLNPFFSNVCAAERCRCVTDGETVAAALYWFDAAFEREKFAYLYAVATHPDFRNRGLCRALMADTLDCLKARGYDGALLMPHDAALREMYRNMGFRDCCRFSELSCTAGVAVNLRQVEKEEYARLRREYLPRDGVTQERENLVCLEIYASFYAGADFLLAAAPEEEGLFGLELLGNANAAPGILGALGYPKGRFRTPGSEKNGAMFRPLKQAVKAPGYLGFVFD